MGGKKGPVVPRWIPSERWMSLIGLKDWKPEWMNGFCWSLQGWTQKERQRVQCVFVWVGACTFQHPCPYRTDRGTSNRRQKYSARAASTSRPIKQSVEEHDKESDFHSPKYTHVIPHIVWIHLYTRYSMSAEGHFKQYMTLKASWSKEVYKRTSLAHQRIYKALCWRRNNMFSSYLFWR